MQRTHYGNLIPGPSLYTPGLKRPSFLDLVGATRPDLHTAGTLAPAASTAHCRGQPRPASNVTMQQL